MDYLYEASLSLKRMNKVILPLFILKDHKTYLFHVKALSLDKLMFSNIRMSKFNESKQVFIASEFPKLCCKFL